MRRFLRQVLKWAVIVPAGAYLALALVFWVWGTIQLHIELRRWEALGVPTRLEDTRPPDVPPETNAAPLYESLRGKLKLSKEEAEALQKPWEIEDPAAFIAPYRDILATLHEAAKRPNLVWDKKYYTTQFKSRCDYENIMEVWDEIYPTGLLRLLLLESIVHYSNGQAEAGKVALESARTLIQRPSSPGMELSAFSELGMEVRYIWAIYEFSHRPYFEIGSVNPPISAIDAPRTFQKAMVSQFLLIKDEFDVRYHYSYCRFGQLDHFYEGIHPGNWPFMRGIQSINTANRSKIYRGLYNQASDCRAESKLVAFQEERETHLFLKMYDYLFNKEAEYWGKAQPLSTNASLQGSALRTAIRIMKYKNANGTYPETWGMPVDPYADVPLNYERLDDGGFMISRTTGYYGFENWEWRWPGAGPGTE